MIALAWVMNASLTVAQLQWLIAPWPDNWPWRNGLLPAEIATTIGGGLLGGYAMFSTASIETIRLAKKHRYGAATHNGLGNLAICTLS